MMPSGYFDTYHETNNQLLTLRGLIIALEDIITESPALDHKSHETAPITSLMQVIAERARTLPDLHEREWDAVRAASFPTAGA